MEQTSLLRILDAAANRAGEAIRVVEDYVRFALDDRHLTELCKRLRHDLTSAMTALPIDQLHAARQTTADVGTDVVTDQEYQRRDAHDVLAANFKRLQQSLRSLEEYAKIVSPETGTRFESLRYRAYTLERAIGITDAAVEQLAEARLYILIDGGPTPEAMIGLAESLVAVGVDLIQLRDKQLPDRELLERARLLRQITRDTPTRLIVNDRPDIAALAQADGVHLGQDELTVKDARTILGPERLIGVSTHSIEQAQAAVLDGANYIGVGPTFPSDTKTFDEFAGIELLEAVAAEIRLPAFAIGGIDRENLAQVLATGIPRIAVGAAVTGQDDPAAVAAALAAML